MCCVCWSIHMTRAYEVAMIGRIWQLDWTELPTVTATISVAHHEPEGVHGDDDDTIPLCEHHHTGPAFVSRHPGNAAAFWWYYRIDWEEVRDEMRRRVSNG